jgi:hypothetical protein
MRWENFTVGDRGMQNYYQDLKKKSADLNKFLSKSAIFQKLGFRGRGNH